MNEVSTNLAQQKKLELKQQDSVETAGTIASNNQPTLFTTTVETAGTIASNSSDSSSGGGFCANA